MLQASEVVELLAVFTNDEIQNGLLQYHISGPRTAAGYLRKPAGGDLYQFLMNLRGKAEAEAWLATRIKSTPKSNTRKHPTPEAKQRMAELVKQAGYRKKVK